MEVRFWGVRGSVAVSGAQVARIGGNTSCVEVTAQGQRLILDAGTGIRALGDAMMKEAQPSRATLLFSHLHWDHVQGFPFFTPAFIPGNELGLFGPGEHGDVELEKVLRKQMQPPSFPVTLEAMRSTMRFGAAVPGQARDIGPFRVTPFELPHPQGCLGYRIEADGRTFVYATDVEISLESLSTGVGRFFEGADALCLDAQYTPDEYAGRGGMPRKGWGHSTMVDAARIAKAVGAGQLLMFHHDPAHNDDTVAAMAEEARGYFPRAEPAREGATVRLESYPWCA